MAEFAKGEILVACRSCGKKIDYQEEICPYCQANQKDFGPGGYSKKKMNKGVLIALISVGVLAVGGGAAAGFNYLANKGKIDHKNEGIKLVRQALSEGNYEKALSDFNSYFPEGKVEELAGNLDEYVDALWGSVAQGKLTEAQARSAVKILQTINGSSVLTEIKVATSHDVYYTSDHLMAADNPLERYFDQAQMKLDNMRSIEEKYGISLKFTQMTRDGIINLINTSVLSGKQDMDLYLLDLSAAIQPVTASIVKPVEEYVPAGDDIFGEQKIVEGLVLPGYSEKIYLFRPVTKNNVLNSAYLLGFNQDLVEEKALENPQKLWEEGRWDWDTFYDYVTALTKDTNSDGSIDVYGYGGYWDVLLNQLLMANGTDIAATGTQHLTTQETINVLNFIDKLYRSGNCRPWNEDDYAINNDCAATGELAFFIASPTILDSWEITGNHFPFKVGVVPFPVGPDASLDGKDGKGTYKTVAEAASNQEWYMVSSGLSTNRAQLIYQVMEDWFDWYGDDLSYRDNTGWYEDAMGTKKNFDLLCSVANDYPGQLDMWGLLSREGEIESFSLVDVLKGVKTPSQKAQEYGQVIQSLLDSLYKK